MDYIEVIFVVFCSSIFIMLELWSEKKQRTIILALEVMLGNFGFFVGIICTMAVTWIETGHNIKTENGIHHTSVLLWCLAPFWYALSLVFGDTLSDITKSDQYASVILGCCIVMFNTIFPNMDSPAYADVIQLFAIFIGLWLTVPYALKNDKVDSHKLGLELISEIESKDLFSYIDYALLLVFSGIPWQIYFQRLLSKKSTLQAKALSYFAGFGCFIISIPLVIIRIAASATVLNESKIYDGAFPMTSKAPGTILPTAMLDLTPEMVSLFARVAIAVALISSSDACVLSISSMFARNIYSKLLRRNASKSEIVCVLRWFIVVVVLTAAITAFSMQSIYGLWLGVCSDFVYVILFPQLIMAVHFKHYCNTYGSLAAYIVGFSIRVACGEPKPGLKPLIYFPDWMGVQKLFPFRTVAMLCSLFTLVSVSWATKWLFLNSTLTSHYEWLRCVNNIMINSVFLGTFTPQEEERTTIPTQQEVELMTTPTPHEGELTTMPSFHDGFCSLMVDQYALNTDLNYYDDSLGGSMQAIGMFDDETIAGEMPEMLPTTQKDRALDEISDSGMYRMVFSRSVRAPRRKTLFQYCADMITHLFDKPNERINHILGINDVKINTV
ncbi:Sodium/solute symporter [Cinara cedri]|uniref:Sodium/solute symporter n=1 Tax=Cinara cedri TaxID=506608 RepID=A0A5E4NE12_9HEMI|nr:Sodium/solute symporter [Cinara cedri]